MPHNRWVVRVSISFISLFSLASCIPVGTTVTINSPSDGATVQVNTNTSITATATDAIGITRLELWDEGVIASTSQSTLAEGQSSLTTSFVWTPHQTGTRLLVVKAFNRQSSDTPSALAVLNLQITDAGAFTPTVTIAAAVTATPTRTSTLGPSPTPSATPTQTTTPTPSVTPTQSATPTPTASPTNTPMPVPSAPSNLTASGAGTSIQFAWQENSIGELGFRIYEQGGVAPVVDNIPAHIGTGGMTFSLQNLQCNKSGTYLVKAFNAAGESQPSNTANAVTVPCAPSNLIVNPATSTSINFSFNNNATNESGYTFYTSNSTTPLPPISLPIGLGTKSGSVSGLQCGATASFFVRAFNSAGESSNSNVMDATTPGCNITVTFTQLHVIDDSNPKPPSCGGLVPCNASLWLDFLVNNQSKRFPSTNTVKASTGDMLPITGTVYSLVMPRSQSLSINVTGTDQHTFQPNHPLGTLAKTYSGSDNWGAGTHTEKSTCPGGCYEVTYSIDVKP